MASLCVKAVQSQLLIIFISTLTSLMSQLHLVPSDLGTAYCTEKELGNVHFTPQSFGKIGSIGGQWPHWPTAAHCGFFQHVEQGWVWPGLSVWPPLRAADEQLQSLYLSLQAVHRVSAGLPWLWCKHGGSPCSVERSPARPPQSGPGR